MGARDVASGVDHDGDDQAEDRGLFVGDLADQHGNGLELGLLGGPPAALARDDLQSVPHGAREDRLEDPGRADRGREVP